MAKDRAWCIFHEVDLDFPPMATTDEDCERILAFPAQRHTKVRFGRRAAKLYSFTGRYEPGKSTPPNVLDNNLTSPWCLESHATEIRNFARVKSRACLQRYFPRMEFCSSHSETLLRCGERRDTMWAPGDHT